MALLNVGDVVGAVAALMDDPGQSEIDQDYVLPFLNLRWSNLIVNLSMLGLQSSEEEAIFALPAATTTLSRFMLPGQPLAALMEPTSIDWKPVGAPDDQYSPAAAVREVDDVEPNSEGVIQYAFKGGTVVVSPSAIPVTVRVRFNAMSTSLVDATDNIIRGVGDILAFRVAELIYAVRGNPLKADMKAYGDTALDDFISLSVMRDQANFYRIPPTHRRGFKRGVTLAPSTNR